MILFKVCRYFFIHTAIYWSVPLYILYFIDTNAVFHIHFQLFQLTRSSSFFLDRTRGVYSLDAICWMFSWLVCHHCTDYWCCCWICNQIPSHFTLKVILGARRASGKGNIKCWCILIFHFDMDIFLLESRSNFIVHLNLYSINNEDCKFVFFYTPIISWCIHIISY